MARSPGTGSLTWASSGAEADLARADVREIIARKGHATDNARDALDRLERAFADGALERTPFLEQAMGDLRQALEQDEGQKLGGKSAEASRFHPPRRRWRPCWRLTPSGRRGHIARLHFPYEPVPTEGQRRPEETHPPGQYLTQKWPVLHYGSVPTIDIGRWDFRVWGEVEEPFTFDWAAFREMPRAPIHTDIHCVTRWSRLDAEFEGVPIGHLLARARPTPEARFVVAHAEQGIRQTCRLTCSTMTTSSLPISPMVRP